MSGRLSSLLMTLLSITLVVGVLSSRSRGLYDKGVHSARRQALDQKELLDVLQTRSVSPSKTENLIKHSSPPPPIVNE